jgi:hypothetical protein
MFMFCVLECLVFCSPANCSLVGWLIEPLFGKYTVTAMNAVPFTAKEEMMV